MYVRLAIATVVSTCFLWLMPARWGGLSSFVYTFPVIIFCVGYIGQQKSSQYATGLAFLIPAVGYTSWKYAIVRLDLDFLALQQGGAHALRLLQFSAEGTSYFLAAAAIAAAFMSSKKITFFLAILAAISHVNRHLLLWGAKELDHGDPLLAAQLVLIPELLRWTPLILLGWFVRHESRQNRWLLSVAAIIGCWLVSPLVWFELGRLEVGKPHPNSPIGKPGLGVAFVSANPTANDFHQQLNAQGSEILPGKGWWCFHKTRPNWQKNTRATAGLALDKDYSLHQLKPQLIEILSRGITRLALIGTTKKTVTSPLGSHLAYPAARWLLDPPPEKATKGIVENGQVTWHSPLPDKPTACAVWAPWDTTAGELFQIGQHYGAPNAPCAYRLFLVFGSKKFQEGQWNSPIPCEKNRSIFGP